MKQMINELRHRIQQCVGETEQARVKLNQRRQQIVKVMPEDRLQQLLKLDENQLENMTYAQIKGAPR